MISGAVASGQHNGYQNCCVVGTCIYFLLHRDEESQFNISPLNHPLARSPMYSLALVRDEALP